LLFTKTHGNPEMAVLDETVELKHFYGDALVFGQHFEDFKWQS
jgi:hypothetical protein